MSLIRSSAMPLVVLFASVSFVPLACEVVADNGVGMMQLAQTDGQERRDDRSDDRNDRQDDRQDCRTTEGAGSDKRDCKQDERQPEEASTTNG